MASKKRKLGNSEFRTTVPFCGVTNETGTFTRIPVEPGVTFNYQASKGGHQSETLQAGPFVANTENYVGDIVLSSPIMTITLTWGVNPRDLDSHLTAKLADNTTLHVYYVDMGSLTSMPFASLDTDDTHSYGPELYQFRSFSQELTNTRLDTTLEKATYPHQAHKLT